MCAKTKQIAILLGVWTSVVPLRAGGKKLSEKENANVQSTESSRSVLWQDPTDISSRDLFFGAGGSENRPVGPYTFVKEDLKGTNPKFVVEDGNRVKWTVKLGVEAKPETVAARLLWSAGYFADEDYFLPEIKVQEMPLRLHRGQKLVAPGAILNDVRLKRERSGEKKIGTWRWRDNPFRDTRELDGLRVVMAVMNNWDLKDENNAILGKKDERIYMVSDLGASFGTSGFTLPLSRAKGNLHSYAKSKFIVHVAPTYVDFGEPAAPPFLFVFNLPQYVSRAELRWIGKRVPRQDARWMGELLGRLSARQIQDAFRSAGYTVEECQEFGAIVERRIGNLREL